MLEEAGLVRTEKNRGVFVREIPVQEALEIFEVRALMDAHVAASWRRRWRWRRCASCAAAWRPWRRPPRPRRARLP